ncbi:MAG TPA: PBP1A family penicillin-binding protein [Thermoanaerobaculia bacterium]|jgi:penicillin-binding protein 1B|nr:PBP1A family penicillin-binding protein [Thermoanaerobaculia bacterium]
MPDLAPRLPTRRTVFKIISISVTALIVVFVLLFAYVYKVSVGKFQLRRLSLPTRIFADYTPLKPDVPLQSDDLLEKLNRLGYRQSDSVTHPGDYKAGRGQIDIYTREFRHPSGEYPAQPVRVTFRRGAIESVVSLREARPIETAALEPELLTSILSEQLENRRPVTLDQVPKHLQDAVVVTEDIRFWHHPGVDPLGITRAIFRNIRAHSVTEGGSTLTQQLVKNYYLTSERTLRRKVVEAFMAVILDWKYSKQEILEAYLNDIYLGRNRSISILGVGEASRFYFGKPVSEIDVAQAAMLAGLIRSPNNNSPFVNPERALTRRNTVLDLMLHYRKIDRERYEKAKAEPLPRKPFREKSGLGSIPFYVDRVLQEMSRDYGVDDVKGRGLQIYTAIDLNAQSIATQTIDASLGVLEKSYPRLRRSATPLQGAIIHVDVPSGEIRALVGGRNYDQSQFNRALNAKRQVGSLFKPFVYLTAFEPSLSNQNITPATLVSDQRFVLKRRFSANWSPRNYEDSYHDTVTVREALEQSMNSATVRVGLACGIDPIVKTAKTLGIQTELDGSNPSIILGAADIPPIEMADAFSTIARLGSRLPLRTIRFVTNDRGTVLSTSDDIQPVQVFPARDVFILTDVMKGVIDRGTAARARSMGFRRVAAGKTGTTNDKRDAWFIGFTPQTLALTWVGFDDNAPIGLAGGEGAVPIWARYMNAVTSGQPNLDFGVPDGISFVQMDETSGGLATPYCPPYSIVNQAFKSGTEPMILCPLHSPQMPMMTGLDQFGNPIALDTVGITSPEATSTTGTELGGGVFRTDTGTPPPPPPPPPKTETREPPKTDTTSQPAPSTNTSSPPTTTTT